MAILLDPAPTCSLARLPRGVDARIVRIEAAAAMRLAAHGFRAGATLRVERDAPFRGPRIVRLGAARIAVAGSIARCVEVRPDPGQTGRT